MLHHPPILPLPPLLPLPTSTYPKLTPPTPNTKCRLLEGASSLGFLFGPLLGGILSAKLGFRLLFVLMTVPVLFLFLLLLFRPLLILPPTDGRAGPVYDSASDEEEEEDEDATVIRASQDPRLPSSSPSPTQGIYPASLSPYESFATSTRKLFRALGTTPTLPLYIAAVLLVSGGLAFMDTSLAGTSIRLRPTHPPTYVFTHPPTHPPMQNTWFLPRASTATPRGSSLPSRYVRG